MARIPTKFFVFAAAGAFMFLYVLPHRAELASRILRDRRAGAMEEEVRSLIAHRVREGICRFEDACQYTPMAWDDFHPEGADAASMIHTFEADGSRRKFLFRIRGGRVSEIVDML